MKYLAPTQHVLGMQICYDRKAKNLWLLQEKYIEWVLSRFNIKIAKLVSTPLANHFKLIRKTCPSTQQEMKDMTIVPYSSVVGSLMYTMVCTRTNNAHIVSLVGTFLWNLVKDH